MKHEIEHSFSFESGHVASHKEGPCSFPHGHSYILIVCCEAFVLQDQCDLVQAMIDNYFHRKWLNETLKMAAPLLDDLAQWIFHFLDCKLSGLKAIKLYDSPLNFVCYKH